MVMEEDRMRWGCGAACGAEVEDTDVVSDSLEDSVDSEDLEMAENGR